VASDCDDGIRFEAIGNIALKGHVEPIPLYRARERA